MRKKLEDTECLVSSGYDNYWYLHYRCIERVQIRI